MSNIKHTVTSKVTLASRTANIRKSDHSRQSSITNFKKRSASPDNVSGSPS